MSGSVSLPIWAAIVLPLISAVIALSGNLLAARLQRRTGAETVSAMKESTQVTRASASASERSANAAVRAAATADQAERQLDRFRQHDDTMRTLYWAADHAVSSEANNALLGLEVLGTLAEQIRDDANRRAGRIVSATDAAVRKVAVPTFLAVLATAANGDSGSGGNIRVSAVEITASRLLLAHALDLRRELRAEIELIASSMPGVEVTVELLHTGRSHEPERVHEQEQAHDLEHEYELEL